MPTRQSEPVEFEILDGVILPPVHRGRPRIHKIETNVIVRRGRPPIDNSQLFAKVEDGLKSKELKSIHHAARVLSEGVKGPSKDAIAQRIYRRRKAAGIR
jgi:hypothetical protein